ncbi:mobilization protein, partial [Bacteroides ovatus]
MGYFTLDFKKAKGASDARMSDHIERRVIASNVDPTRTHLNRELVQLPKGVPERDDA